jgi:hypothetical protein
MKYLLLFLLFSFFGYSQSHEKNNSSTNSTEVSFPKGDQFKNANLTYKIIPAANNTWCYDILMEGRMFIHQPSAPGLPGNEGFKTKEGATKVAELVISKMKKGEMPPSVTIDEMKELKALN